VTIRIARPQASYSTSPTAYAAQPIYHSMAYAANVGSPFTTPSSNSSPQFWEVLLILQLLV
jgi:hypothetical protein